MPGYKAKKVNKQLPRQKIINTIQKIFRDLP